jgi:hypothetical protein
MRGTEDCTQTSSCKRCSGKALTLADRKAVRGAQTQLLVEHVGGGGQKIAQPIGEEAAAPVQRLLRP